MAVDLFNLLQPAVVASGLELIDAELRSNVLMVTVDRPGGVDLEGLTETNRVVSAILDAQDPIPGHYTLEVSSPGVERTLRRPAHFVRAVGETITVKTRPQVPGDRRLTGTLRSADEQGLVLDISDAPEGQGERHLAYSDLDRARTVFQWGPAPKPGKTTTSNKARGKSTRSTTRTSGGDDQLTQKRKQVTTP